MHQIAITVVTLVFVSANQTLMNMQLIRREATESFKCGTDRRRCNRKIEIKMEKKQVKKEVIQK